MVDGAYFIDDPVGSYSKRKFSFVVSNKRLALKGVFLKGFHFVDDAVEKLSVVTVQHVYMKALCKYKQGEIMGNFSLNIVTE